VITTLPDQLRRSLASDQGAEIVQHAQLRIHTGLEVCFRYPPAPGSAAPTRIPTGLLRQYFPKGTDLSRHPLEDLQAGRVQPVIGYSERLADSKIVASVGSKGDSFDTIDGACRSAGATSGSSSTGKAPGRWSRPTGGRQSALSYRTRHTSSTVWPTPCFPRTRRRRIEPAGRVTVGVGGLGWVRAFRVAVRRYPAIGGRLRFGRRWRLARVLGGRSGIVGPRRRGRRRGRIEVRG